MSAGKQRHPKPAEAIAMSLCVMSRSVGQLPIPSMGEERLHPRRCRFCDTDKAELLERIRAFNAVADVDDIEAFTELSKPARYARIREQQETSWFDEVRLSK